MFGFAMIVLTIVLVALIVVMIVDDERELDEPPRYSGKLFDAEDWL